MLFLRRFLFAFLLFDLAWAQSEVTEFMEKFHKNPARYMEQLPPEIKDGKVIPRGFIKTNQIKLMIPDRDETRRWVISQSQNGLRSLARIEDDNRPSDIIEPGQMIANIFELDAKGLLQAKLNRTPYSDTYWPTYKGLIGARYADRGFPHSKNWGINHQYILNHPALPIFISGAKDSINRLSPAEKYDLLMGDYQMTLTRYAWDKGRVAYESRGVVPSWTGLCHGWSAANHMYVPLPSNPVTVLSTNRTPITFYQSDIKALWAMLWAQAPVPTRFVGKRCNISRPLRDSFGRIMDSTCWDVNPGTFYLTIANQIGLHQRGFVVDSSLDYQVWNHSATSYKAQYFNPQTLAPTAQLRDAMVPISQFKIDKFKKYRNSDTAYVVGMMMDLSIVNATAPRTSTQTSVFTKTIRLFFDLEIDHAGQVIGGEWYTNAHPDFIWTFDRNADAYAPGDYKIDPKDWNVGEMAPEDWLPHVKESSRRGMPLNTVIYKILENEK